MLDGFLYAIILYIFIIELYLEAKRDREEDEEKDI